MAPDIDLLATCWTSAGNAAPQRGDEVSPVPILERVAAAASTGWTGMGFVHADLARARDDAGLEALAAELDARGIRFREVEIIADWWTTGPRREAADRLRDDLFHAASVLGARHVKVLACLDEPPPRERFVRELRELSERAADAGVRLALEPMPFSTNVATLQDGVDLAEEVGHPALGLTIDTWHVYRAGTPYDRIPEIVPPELVVVVELDDCAAEAVGGLWEDTVDHRRLPGDGDADPAEFVRRVAETGFDGPWGVEIISEELRGLELAEGLRRTAARSRAAVREGLARAGR